MNTYYIPSCKLLKKNNKKWQVMFAFRFVWEVGGLYPTQLNILQIILCFGFFFHYRELYYLFNFKMMSTCMPFFLL